MLKRKVFFYVWLGTGLGYLKEYDDSSKQCCEWRTEDRDEAESRAKKADGVVHEGFESGLEYEQRTGESL